jgi:hypothetical protein
VKDKVIQQLTKYADGPAFNSMMIHSVSEDSLLIDGLGDKFDEKKNKKLERRKSRDLGQPLSPEKRPIQQSMRRR